MERYLVKNLTQRRGEAAGMGYLTCYVVEEVEDGKQWHCWRQYTSVCGKLTLKSGTLCWHKDAGWKTPVAFVAVVERVSDRIRYAVVIPPLTSRVTKKRSMQWVAFTSRTDCQGAPPTEATNQKNLCFRPAAVDALPGPPNHTYEIILGDGAVLEFINRCRSVQACKGSITKFREHHGITAKVMTKVQGESTTTTT